MIIIFEGVDGSGKSTLAKLVGDKLGYPVYKDNRGIELGLEPLDIQGHDRGSVEMAVQTGVNVIFDRSFPSDAVYGPVESKQWAPGQVQHLDRRVSQVPHLAVLVQTDYATTFQRRPEIEGWPEGVFEEMQHTYVDYAENSSMRWIVLDGSQPLNLMLEAVLGVIQRPSRDTVFMNIARVTCQRSTCLSRHTGAVLVSPRGHVIATGYNGVPTGVPHPTQCDRLRAGIESGKQLDGCLCGHAEENALVQAALNGSNPSGGTMYSLLSPCARCARMIVNAGISEVVYEKLYLDQRSLDMLAQSGVKVRQL